MGDLELWLQEHIGEHVGLTYQGGIQCGGRVECVDGEWVRLTDVSTGKRSICALAGVVAAFEPTPVAPGRVVSEVGPRRRPG